MYKVYVGIDDTDSKSGMCTTYVTTLIINELKHFGFNIEGYPRLIRLNPFVKFKTRGNGATSFRLNLKSKDEYEEVKSFILKRIKELSQLQDDETNPAVVFYDGEINENLSSFSIEVIKNIVTIKDAHELANKISAEFFKFKKGRGIIGALAAIGCPRNDNTYELLAYRTPENYGKKRQIDDDSVFRMDMKMYPQTFDNIDGKYIAIEPHTPCPILYGIRGESPEAVLGAHKMVKTYEPVERFVVFETNQHTDMHLIKIDHIADMDKYKCYIVEGVVKRSPYIIEGGHIIFIIEDDSGQIPCAAYEPTKEFRDTVKELTSGDLLRVYGGIGEKGTLNIEKIEIIKLTRISKTLNPLCECGKRMKSAGSGKGFKCIKCGRKLKEDSKEVIDIKRKIKEGFYEVPPSARRHLSKPLVRIQM